MLCLKQSQGLEAVQVPVCFWRSHYTNKNKERVIRMTRVSPGDTQTGGAWSLKLHSLALKSRLLGINQGVGGSDFLAPEHPNHREELEITTCQWVTHPWKDSRSLSAPWAEKCRGRPATQPYFLLLWTLTLCWDIPRAGENISYDPKGKQPHCKELQGKKIPTS